MEREPAAAAAGHKSGKSEKQRSLSDTFRSLTASGTDIESLGIETFASLKDSDRRVMQVIGRVIMRAQKVLREEVPLPPPLSPLPAQGG